MLFGVAHYVHLCFFLSYAVYFNYRHAFATRNVHWLLVDSSCPEFGCSQFTFTTPTLLQRLLFFTPTTCMAENSSES